MTDKKKRQRGSRTHGGGSGKNRRGAGHRGGRGAAGRDKHEQQLHEPLGKSGFSRPEGVQDTVETVDVQTLDEDIAVLTADGVAEETDGGYRVDVRDIVPDGHDVDVVKLLGSGQVHHELTVVADAFSETARQKIEAGGGSTEISDRASNADDK
jgi:large subunit ribosomal protein L15